MKHIIIIILCAFAVSCRCTKSTSIENESERNAISQAQWRSAHNLSFSDIQRITALSLDSCIVTFMGADKSATPECPYISYPSGKPSDTAHGKPSDTTHGKPTDTAQGKPTGTIHGKPSSFKIYGLHLSLKEKEKSAATKVVEDSTAIAMQSSFGKAQSTTKTKSSVPLVAMLGIAAIILIMAAAIYLYIRRRRFARRTQFGSKIPHQ